YVRCRRYRFIREVSRDTARRQSGANTKRHSCCKVVATILAISGRLSATSMRGTSEGMTVLRTGLLGCLVWGILLHAAGGAESAARLSADIEPRPLPEALAAFGRQTGLQLIYLSGVAETQRSPGAPAGSTASAALTQLLEGTGLTFEFLNDRTVR